MIRKTVQNQIKEKVKYFYLKFSFHIRFLFLIKLTTFKLHKFDIFHNLFVFISQRSARSQVHIHSILTTCHSLIVYSNTFFFSMLKCEKGKRARVFFALSLVFSRMWIQSAGWIQRKKFFPFKFYVSWLLSININISISFI